MQWAMRGRRRARASDGLALIASFMLASAGLAHLSVAPAHFGEWWVFGVLFLIAAGLQLGFAVVLVLRPSAWIMGAAAVLSLGLVATWVLSRTSGLPFGPDPGAAEGAGPLDVLTTLNELALAILVGVAVGGLRDQRSPNLLLACEASGVALSAILALAFAGGIGHA